MLSHFKCILSSNVYKCSFSLRATCGGEGRRGGVGGEGVEQEKEEGAEGVEGRSINAAE